MKFLTSNCIITIVFLYNHQLLTEAGKPSSSWFSPKNVNFFLESLEPYFYNLITKVGNSSLANPTLQIFRDTLSYSAEENEDWSKFLKRVGNYLLTENKNVVFKKNFLNNDFTEGLIMSSPQFLKGTIMSRLRGSVWQMVDEKLQNIVNKLMSGNSSERVDGKQVGLAFDPFVIGANGLLNLLYATAFAAFVTPTMGLENLFNPDYDFDYDSLNEDIEGKDGQSSSTSVSTTMTTAASNQPHNYLIEQQELLNQHQESSEAFAKSAHNRAEVEPSTYLHYDGQRFRSNPSLIQNVIDNPQEKIYHYLKMYKPNMLQR